MPQFDSMGAFRLNYLADSDDGEIRICAADNCKESTRKRKPYCSRHVEQHVYVKELMDRLDHRVVEDDEVNREGSDVANLEGITAREILLQLRLNGPRTLERLERELQIARSIVYKYAVALKRDGIVTFNTNNRGSVTVELVDRSRELMIDDE